ncbi:MAG TPA: hypothetical protein VF202_04225 [Trueperaceae bacterium]
MHHPPSLAAGQRLADEAEGLARSAIVAPAVRGGQTVASVVSYALGVAGGTYGRSDGAAARVLSPVRGPWAGAEGPEPPQDGLRALHWISTELSLRQAGVPGDTIRDLYRLYVVELNAVAESLSGGQATVDPWRTAAATLLAKPPGADLARVRAGPRPGSSGSAPRQAERRPTGSPRARTRVLGERADPHLTVTGTLSSVFLAAPLTYLTS